MVRLHLALLLLFTGCSVHSPLQLENPVTIPQTFINADTADSNKGVNISVVHWWESFNDEELNKLVAKALTKNYELQGTLSRLAQAEAAWDIASASFWPELGLSAEGERSLLNFRTFRPTTSNFQASSAVSYEVDLWQRISYGAQAGEADALASKEDYRTAAIGLAAQVADSYFLVVEICEQLELLNQTILSDESLLKLTERRYKNGVAEPLDVHQARQNLATSLARKPEFALNLVRGQHSLTVLEGDYPGLAPGPTRAALDCSGKKLSRKIQKLDTGVPSELLMNRPDVRAALLRLKAADARIGEAVADRFPSIRLNASGAYAGTEIDNVFTPENLLWRIALDIGLTVIDGGRKRSQVRLKEAVLDELIAAYHVTVLKAFEEVENALYGVRAKQEQVALLESKAEAAGKSLRLSTAQYLQGLKDYLPVLVSQAAYYNARSELLRVRREYLSTYVQLARALGGGWTEEELIKRAGYVE